MKLPIQKIFRKVLRVLRLPRAAVAGVLDGRFDAAMPADAQHTLIVHADTLVMPQVVIDAAVALVRAIHVNLLDFCSNPLILGGSWAELTGGPFVISTAGHFKQLARNFYRIVDFDMAFLDSRINMALPYL